jgi:hypothetical protein
MWLYFACLDNSSICVLQDGEVPTGRQRKAEGIGHKRVENIEEEWQSEEQQYLLAARLLWTWW